MPIVLYCLGWMECRVLCPTATYCSADVQLSTTHITTSILQTHARASLAAVVVFETTLVVSQCVYRSRVALCRLMVITLTVARIIRQ